MLPKDIVNFSMYSGMYSDGAHAVFTGRDGETHKLYAVGRPRKYYIDDVETDWENVKRIVGRQTIHPRQGNFSDWKESMNETSELKPYKVTYKTTKGKTSTCTIKARDEKEAKAKCRSKPNYNGDAVANLVESQEDLGLSGGSGRGPGSKEAEYISYRARKRYDDDNVAAGSFNAGEPVKVKVGGLYPFSDRRTKKPTKLFPEPHGIVTGTIIEPSTAGHVWVKLDKPIKYRHTFNGDRVTKVLDKIEVRHGRITKMSNESVTEGSTSYEKDMKADKPVVVKGVKGMKSTPFTKKFKNQAAYEKWADSDAAGDFDVQEVMNEGNFWGQDKMVAKMKSDEKKKGLVRMRKTDKTGTHGATVPQSEVDKYKAKGYSIVSESQLNEGVLDDMDDDGFMAKRQLYDIAKYSVELHRMIQDTDNLEPWIQAKITKASDYIDTVKHYMEYQGVRGAEDSAEMFGMDDIADVDATLDSMGPYDVNYATTEDLVNIAEDDDEGSVVYAEDVLRWASNRGIISNDTYDMAVSGKDDSLWDAAQDTADSIGEVWEIGSSDVSIWLRDFVHTAKSYGAALDGERAHLYENRDKAKSIYKKMTEVLRKK